MFADDDVATSPANALDLVSMNADGFTITNDVGTSEPGVVYLALKGVKVAQGVLAQPTSTGNQSVTGAGFQPSVVLFDGGDKATVDGFEDNAEMVFGVATSSTERAAIWIGSVSRTSPYPSDTDLSTSAVIRSLTAGTPSVDAVADFVSMDSDGFTINWSTADATQRRVGWIALAPGCSGDRTVQSGTATIAANNPSTTATLSPALADTAKAFLVFSMSVDDNRPEYTQVRGQITNTTTLTFQRDNTGGIGAAVTIEWYVVEFATGVTVKRGSETMSSATRNVTLTPSVDPNKSFPIISYQAGGGNMDRDDFIRARITGGGATLELTTNTIPTGGIVDWQVVEYDDSMVQTGDLSFLTTDSSKTATLTNTFNRNKSWLIYTYKTDNPAVADDIGEMLVRGVVTDNDTLTFDRDNTGQAMDLTWFLVEFIDDTVVQHANQNFTTSETQKDVTIQKIGLNSSIAAGGYFDRGGEIALQRGRQSGCGMVHARFDECHDSPDHAGGHQVFHRRHLLVGSGFLRKRLVRHQLESP